jgi:hypothetical protein
MKNIHILPKNIFNQLGVDHYGKTPTQIKIAEFLISKNIYITDNSEIKEGDYIIELDGNEVFRSKGVMGKNDWCKKIILTTDQDLIKDGVQPIDDEFLEWLVKNRSCEKVEVDKNWNYPLDKNWEYQIIIPKEEPKQEAEQINVGGGSGSLPMYDVEELNEIIKLFNDKEIDLYTCIGRVWNKAYFIGAKEMAKRMYSEEDVKEAFRQGQDNMDYSEMFGWDSKLTEQQWFEQFKKK